MYCKNCGAEFPYDETLVCTVCGVKKGDGQKFCWNCGKEVTPGSDYCMNCGVQVAPQNAKVPGQKSKLVAGLLGIFLGCLGVHNFYLGYNTKAVIQLVLTIVGTVLSCIGVGVFLIIGASIWGLVEGIMVLTGNINVDAAGNPIGE